MKAVVAAFNQEKALVGAFSVITNLWMELFEALLPTHFALFLYRIQNLYLHIYVLCIVYLQSTLSLAYSCTTVNLGPRLQLTNEL